MKSFNAHTILVLNGGSSSIKFALYEMAETINCLWQGKAENIGTSNATLQFLNPVTKEEQIIPLKAADFISAANSLVYWLEELKLFSSVQYVGHRIVHGMHHAEPTQITPELLKELKEISVYAPEHLPNEIKLIELIRKISQRLIQFACFDTAFHATMPPVAKRLPIPRKFQKKGIQRYGFHGLSYSYLMVRLTEKKEVKEKMILLHLGNGASLAAVKNGKCIETSMGFTPTAGLPMGTRTGDLDPGLAWYLMKSENLDPDAFNKLINQQSGLLGISEISADMEVLLGKQHIDIRAYEAIDFFCYHVRKWIGSFTAVLGGVDTIVFTGGIGENAPEIRTWICKGLEFLGVEIDEAKNFKNEETISSTASKVTVHMIKTNEEWMIARLVDEVLRSTIDRKELLETEK